MAFEIFPHLSVMLYRIMRDRPAFLRWVFLGTALLIFTGTFLEQWAVGLFYFHAWRKLPLFYKIIGPILHICFMSAQIHGGRVCLQISSKLKKEVMELRLKSYDKRNSGEHREAGALGNSESELSLDLEANMSSREIYHSADGPPASYRQTAESNQVHLP